MWQWLKKETGFTGIMLWIVLLPIGSIAWGILVGALGVATAQSAARDLYAITEQLGWWIIPTIILLAAVEELLFRVPYTILVRAKVPVFMILVLVIAFSALFGYIHTYSMSGVVRQGMVGLAFSIMYLKCGGANGKFWKPFISSTLAHAANNLVVLALLRWALESGIR